MQDGDNIQKGVAGVKREQEMLGIDMEEKQMEEEKCGVR